RAGRAGRNRECAGITDLGRGLDVERPAVADRTRVPVRVINDVELPVAVGIRSDESGERRSERREGRGRDEGIPDRIRVTLVVRYPGARSRWRRRGDFEPPRREVVEGEVRGV